MACTGAAVWHRRCCRSGDVPPTVPGGVGAMSGSLVWTGRRARSVIPDFGAGLEVVCVSG